MSGPITTYSGVAHPWLCDANDHLNTRHYVGAFDDAAQHFFAALGYRPGSSLGWADVSQQISYRREVPRGALFTIDCEIVKVGRSSVTYRQSLRLLDGDEPAAVLDAVTVHFDLERRTSAPLPPTIVGLAERLIAVREQGEEEA